MNKGRRVSSFLILQKKKMKKGVYRGNENLDPSKNVSGRDPNVPSPGSNSIMDGIARIVQAFKPKRFVSYRKKKTNKDGSIVETEFIYRDDR
jgi:hypothetical protein